MLDFIRNALLNQGAIDNEAWKQRMESDGLREKPAAASLTSLLTGVGEN